MDIYETADGRRTNIPSKDELVLHHRMKDGEALVSVYWNASKFIMAVNGRTDDELKEIFLDMIREHNEENVSTRQPDPRAIGKAEEI